MTSWAPKDPDAVLDYLYRIPLDAGDAVATAALTRISGTVNIDSQGLSGADLTAWLSGGADGETSVFRVAWTTSGGRSNDDIITLAVIESDIVPLALTGYAKPLPGHLVARYPAFADVAASTVQAWLTDAERYVTTAWAEGDYAAGLMSLAAHNLALAGLGADAAALTGVPAGITRMKSGSLELGFTEAAANARMNGGYEATRYGAEYALLLRRNRAGPYVAPTGVLPQAEYPPFGVGWPY